jgi:peptide/nickel transport system permease protein
MSMQLDDAPAAGAGSLLAKMLAAWRRRGRVARHLGFSAGALVLGAIVIVSVFAPLFAPYDPYAQDLAHRLIPPVWHEAGTWQHPLGTDTFGRDYLSRLIYGGRIALLIGVAVPLISGTIGTTLGLIAGFFGGWVDFLVTFVVTVRLALPVILVALAAVALLGTSLPIVIFALGFLGWDRFAVVMRATTQQIANLDYVAAARASGGSTMHILWSEILPNVASNLFVIGTVEASAAILVEASLSFLGLGVQPPLPSWGLMIAEAKQFMFFSPWLITLPGAMIMLLVLAINLLGDGLRDLSAPQGRN